MVPAMSDQAMPVPPSAPGPVYYAPPMLPQPQPQPFTGWPTPRRKLWPTLVAVSVVVGLVVVGGLFAVVGNAYARTTICRSVATINDDSSKGSATPAAPSGGGSTDGPLDTASPSPSRR